MIFLNDDFSSPLTTIFDSANDDLIFPRSVLAVIISLLIVTEKSSLEIFSDGMSLEPWS